jgi:serine/threonine-protein kinase
MALEPFVRRRWPRMLIGWTRVLAGRVRDPHVGRDLLFGVAAGALAGVIGYLQVLAPDWLGQPQPVPIGVVPGASGVLQQLVVGIYQGLIGLFTLLLLRMLVRRDWIAVGILGLFLATFALRGHTPAQILLALLSAALALAVLLRFGLLAITVAIVTANLLFAIPIGFDPSAWYAPPGFLALALIGGFTGWGFYTALAGQPLFGRLLED